MRGKRRGNTRGGGRGGGRKTGQAWSEKNLYNADMEAYYKAQAILPEAEYEEHFEAFRKPLPTTFRLTGSRENATMMRDYMQRTFIPYLKGKMFEGRVLDPPKALPWYPDNLAYSLDIPKQAIRRNPDFQAFQKFLVMESDAGNVVRQEAVSMIPPLLMNIKPDSTCLDMCAAPGSKTSQMVEYLHDNSALSTGLVLANDTDEKRSHMLVHQVKRLNSPNFLVTNHDATFLSNFYSDTSKTVQKFDRVLADVPCSGDGTLRKNYDIWKTWSVTSGLSLHPTQVNCLRRGLQMLAVGGRLVYSTCSLNPIENEAVLHAVLSKVNGAAHLVDVSDQLPALSRRSGLHSWKAVDMQGNFINSIDDVKVDKHRFPTSIFPPTAEIAEDLHLERALRVYPHLGNSGGFFVAVIDKVKELGVEFESVRYKSEKRKAQEAQDQPKAKRHETSTPPVDKQDNVPENVISNNSRPQDGQSNDSGSPADQTKDDVAVTPIDDKIEPKKFVKSLNDEYFTFLPSDHPEVVEIAKHYQLADTFRLDCFLTRNISGDAVRSLYYTSPLVKDMLVHNEGRIKFVHAGVKVFHKQNIDNLQDNSPESKGMCKWRVAQDGVDLIKDAVSPDKIIDCTFAELTIFMQHEYPRASLFPEREGSVTSQLADKKYGCYLLRCDLGKEEDSRTPEVLVVPIWKSKVTIQMMIARQDKVAIYTRVTGKELPPAIKVDGETIKQLGGSKEVAHVEASTQADDQKEAIDTSIADAVANEEEGSAANVL